MASLDPTNGIPLTEKGIELKTYSNQKPLKDTAKNFSELPKDTQAEIRRIAEKNGHRPIKFEGKDNYQGKASGNLILDITEADRYLRETGSDFLKGKLSNPQRDAIRFIFRHIPENALPRLFSAYAQGNQKVPIKILCEVLSQRFIDAANGEGFSLAPFGLTSIPAKLRASRPFSHFNLGSPIDPALIGYQVQSYSQMRRILKDYFGNQSFTAWRLMNYAWNQSLQQELNQKKSCTTSIETLNQRALCRRAANFLQDPQVILTIEDQSELAERTDYLEFPVISSSVVRSKEEKNTVSWTTADLDYFNRALRLSFDGVNRLTLKSMMASDDFFKDLIDAGKRIDPKLEPMIQNVIKSYEKPNPANEKKFAESLKELKQALAERGIYLWINPKKQQLQNNVCQTLEIALIGMPITEWKTYAPRTKSEQVLEVFDYSSESIIKYEDWKFLERNAFPTSLTIEGVQISNEITANDKLIKQTVEDVIDSLKKHQKDAPKLLEVLNKLTGGTLLPALQDGSLANMERLQKAYIEFDLTVIRHEEQHRVDLSNGTSVLTDDLEERAYYNSFINSPQPLLMLTLFLLEHYNDSDDEDEQHAVAKSNLLTVLSEELGIQPVEYVYQSPIQKVEAAVLEIMQKGGSDPIRYVRQLLSKCYRLRFMEPPFIGRDRPLAKRITFKQKS